MAGKSKNGGGKKQYKFGCKQKHGHSRAAYFVRAKARIAANKEKRIAKERKRQQAFKAMKNSGMAQRSSATGS